MAHIVNDEHFEIRLIARGNLAKRVKRQCDRLNMPARVIAALALDKYCDEAERTISPIMPTSEQSSERNSAY